MLETSALVAFLHVTDLARSRAFYEGVLGLTLISDDPFMLVFDANGTTLRVSLVEHHEPLTGTVLGWEVGGIAAAVGELAAAGVEFARYDGMDQDELGVWTTPGGGQVAWFHDPDGNTLSLSQEAAPTRS